MSAPLIVFLDCEYTDPVDIDLISIALVSEDGQEFYAERSDYRREACSEFVHAAVLPLLDAPADHVLTREQLAVQLSAWLTALPCDVAICADDRTDYELLHDAVDGNLPAHVTVLDGETWTLAMSATFGEAVARYHAQPGCPWHHALHDARAFLAGWKAMQSEQKSKVSKPGKCDV
jgi:hypothetical protein